jgi:hypothetical protein
MEKGEWKMIDIFSRILKGLMLLISMIYVHMLLNNLDKIKTTTDWIVVSVTFIIIAGYIGDNK